MGESRVADEFGMRSMVEGGGRNRVGEGVGSWEEERRGSNLYEASESEVGDCTSGEGGLACVLRGDVW